MIEFKKYKLGDIADIIVSTVDKKSKPGQKEVRLCNFVDVYRNWAITHDLYDDFLLATASDVEIERFSIRKGQVAFTKDSETRDDIGIATYIAEDFDDVVLGYHTALVTPHEEIILGKYLNAFMHSKYILKYFEMNATGSGMRYTLSLETLNDIPVLVPSLDEQKKIGDFFSALDRKISLNRKANAELEALAKQIYDYWFVQFDFPDANGRPYKSSGGKMVYDSTIKREIPEGWSSDRLGQIVAEVGIGISVSQRGDLPYTPMDQLPIRKMSFSSSLPTEDAQSSLVKYSKHDILIGAMRVYFHRVCIAPFDGITRTTTLVLRPKQVDYYAYIYERLNADDFINYAIQMSNGSQQPMVSWSSLESMPVLVPSEDIVLKYKDLFIEIRDKVISQNMENKQLSSMRDYILPLLMNGQASLNY